MSANEAEASGASVHRILNLMALGRRDEAAKEAESLLSRVPDFSASNSPVVQAFGCAQDRDKIISTLRQAGLSE